MELMIQERYLLIRDFKLYTYLLRRIQLCHDGNVDNKRCNGKIIIRLILDY